MTPEDMARAAQIRRDDVQDVLRAVAAQTGVSVEAIVGPRRITRYVLARQLAMFICYREGASVSAIARGMQRDRATVSKGIRREAMARGMRLDVIDAEA